MISENQNHNKILTVGGCIISFSIAAFLFASSESSVSSIVNVQNVFLESALIESAGASTIAALNILMSHFYSMIAALIFLFLAFSFLAAYNYYEEDRKTSLLISVIGAIIFIAFLGLTIAAIFLAVGLIASVWIMAPLAHTYGKEFRKWIHFRVGSNATGRAMMLLNVFIAIGVFVAVLSSQAVYEQEFRQDLKESLSDVVSQQLPPGITEAQIDALIEQRIDSVPLFSAYITWLPVTSAFTLWVLLEFLRLFLTNLAGLFTSFLIKIYGKRDSQIA